MGETVAKHCEPVGFHRGRLYVWVKSSARMQEIRFFEFTIRDKVNEHVGRNWVRGIRFTLDRHGVPTVAEMSEEGKKILE